MSLIQQIDNDLKDAMRARDTASTGVLRMLKSALKYSAIEKAEGDTGLDDAEVIQVIRKEIKKREDSIASYEKAARTDLVEKEKAEVNVLSKYLPQALRPEEVATLVQEAIVEAGVTDRSGMGAVMKVASAKAAGRADGRTLSAEVNRQLSQNA